MAWGTGEGTLILKLVFKEAALGPFGGVLLGPCAWMSCRCCVSCTCHVMRAPSGLCTPLCAHCVVHAPSRVCTKLCVRRVTCRPPAHPPHELRPVAPVSELPVAGSPSCSPWHPEPCLSSVCGRVQSHCWVKGHHRAPVATEIECQMEVSTENSLHEQAWGTHPCQTHRGPGPRV